MIGRPGQAQTGELQLSAPITDPSQRNLGSSKNQFYAVGTLYRVKRNDTGTVRYALMDEQGKILAFLAPSSRVDLKTHVGREIGVSARTFGAQEDVAPHVIVDEVTPMASTHQDSGVALASHLDYQEPVSVVPVDGSIETIEAPLQPLPAGQTFDNTGPVPNTMGYDSPGPMYYDGGQSFGACGDGTCDTCSTGPGPYFDSCSTCGVGMPCQCQSNCGPPGWLWLSGEYLLWWAHGMDIPPLVTTSPVGTPPEQAGVLGQPGTQILYGNEQVLKDSRSGFRIRFGGYLGPLRRWSWEGEYFDLGDVDETFTASGNGMGTPILARPFFNINPRVGGTGAMTGPPFEDSELVSYPGILTGTVDVDSYSRFNGAAGRFRLNCCCLKNVGCSPCGSCTGYGSCHQCGYPPYKRIDFSLGYRYYGLREGLIISEDLTSLQSANPGRFQISDQFTTRNDFNGAELGTELTWGWNRWTLESLMRVAIGGTRQQVTINGSTTISPLIANASTFPGGLLAQTSNMGTFTQSEFTMVPELATTLGFYLTPRLRFMVGYTVIYWSSVVRPGDQIDLDVNPDQIAPPTLPLQGPQRPEFAFHTSSFWAQGLSLGLDLRW